MFTVQNRLKVMLGYRSMNLKRMLVTDGHKFRFFPQNSPHATYYSANGCLCRFTNTIYVISVFVFVRASEF